MLVYQTENELFIKTMDYLYDSLIVKYVKIDL